MEWIEEIDASLVAEAAPSLRLPEAFPWAQFEANLRTLFDRSALKLSHSVEGWVTSDKIFKGVGREKAIKVIDLSPLNQQAYFITTNRDLQLLISELFGGEKAASFFFEPSLLQGFYDFFAAEILSELDNLHFASPVVFRLAEEDTLDTHSRFFLIDLTLVLDEGKFFGRVAIPDTLATAWKDFFSRQSAPGLTEEDRKKIPIELGLEVGHSQLNINEWQSVRPGDFVFLDRCTYDPEVKKGSLLLTLNQKPVLRARFKETGIKITEYPMYEEGEEMAEDEEFEEEVGESGEEEEFKTEPEKKSPPSISVKDIPIRLTVEVGRIKMTAQELVELSPGKVLELNVSPEQGVDLLINGKKVGRGELVKVGELLGVRILSLNV